MWSWKNRDLALGSARAISREKVWGCLRPSNLHHVVVPAPPKLLGVWGGVRVGFLVRGKRGTEEGISEHEMWAKTQRDTVPKGIQVSEDAGTKRTQWNIGHQCHQYKVQARSGVVSPEGDLSRNWGSHFWGADIVPEGITCTVQIAPLCWMPRGSPSLPEVLSLCITQNLHIDLGVTWTFPQVKHHLLLFVSLWRVYILSAIMVLSNCLLVLFCVIILPWSRAGFIHLVICLYWCVEIPPSVYWFEVYGSGWIHY